MNRLRNNPIRKCRTDRRSYAGGFTLLEVIAAVGILAIVSSSVLVVIDRCVNATADSSKRMEAFRIVRENMEQVLVASTVSETVDYGMSEVYPDIRWTTVIEGFPEPVSGQMWVRAVCSAEYTDAMGETQTVELEHWITELTDGQAGELLQEEDLEQLAAEQLITRAQEAAEYAGIDEETLAQWVENGLVQTQEGGFIRYNLDIFIDTDGQPTDEEKAMQVESISDLAMALRMEQMQQGGETGASDGEAGVDPLTGRPYEEVETMGVEDVMELLEERRR